jgi:hypothetical protein
MSEHDTADVAALRRAADAAEDRNDGATAQRLRDVAATVENEHVAADEHECECGATFETPNALGGHRSHCTEADTDDGGEE